MRKTLLFFVAIFISGFAYGQGGWIDHTSQVALPSLDVRDVLVDSQGNKWFATANGLAKFDGTSWTTFTAVYQQLRNADIQAVAEGKDGRIWVVTAQDIEVYDGTKWEYHNANNGLLSSASSPQYLSLHVAADGAVWAGSWDGVSRYNGSGWENFTDEDGVSLRYVVDIESDDAGNVLFSLHQGYEDEYTPGVAMFDGSTWSVFDFSTETGERAYFDLNNIGGQVWAGLFEHIFRFENNSWQRVEIDQEALGMTYQDVSGHVVEDVSGALWFPRAEFPGIIKYDGTNWEQFVFEDAPNVKGLVPDGMFMYGINMPSRGVVKINTETNDYSLIGGKFGLSNNHIKKLFIENSDSVWAASFGGIDRFDGKTWQKVQHPSIDEVVNIFRDSRGKIWLVPYMSNVHMLDEGTWTTFNSTNSLLPNREIYAAAADNNGNSYFKFYDPSNSQGPLIMFDGTEWHDITNQHAYLSGHMSNIVTSSDGKVWFFSNAGTVVKDGNQWIADENFPQYPTKAIADNDGGLWLGYGSSKLVHYAAGTSIEYDLSQLVGTHNMHEVRGLSLDHKGHLWVGGYSYSEPYNYPGLARFDGTNWTAFSETDGLISNMVTTVEADGVGNVWIGTELGLSQLILFSEIVTVTTSDVACHGGNDGSITLTPEGNNPPYRYSVDGGETYVSEGVFNNLSAGNYHVIVKDGEGLTAHNEVVTLGQPAGVFEWAVTPVSCAGAGDGAIALTVQNDGAAISYVWRDAAGNELATTRDIASLAGGTYTVTATYGECSVMKSIAVPEPAPLQASLEYLNSCGDAESGQVSVRVTGGTAPFSYSIDGGASYQSERVFAGLGVGSYQVIVRDANACSFTSGSVTITQVEKPAPVIASTGALELCAGNSIQLTTEEAYEGYEWYDAGGNLLSTTESLEVSQAGTFHVVVYQNQCQAVSETVSTSMVSTYGQQEMCIVTVDAVSGKNKLVWAMVEGKGIASYNIYKETGTNQFSLLGSVDFGSDNFFIDESSNPMQASERYSISVIDKCGRESGLSPAHKTIYLQASVGVNNSVNLSWDAYEGFNYSQVNVLRGASVNSLQLLSTRPANNNTFTDTDPNEAEQIYVIEAVAGYSCEGTAGNERVMPQMAYTRSNPGEAQGALGLADNLRNNAGLKVYPNPVDTDITVELEEGRYIREIRLLDVSGRVVQQLPVGVSSSSIRFEQNAKAGIYILEVMDDQAQMRRQRIILE